MEASVPKVAFAPLYAAITGDVASALLLSQVVYWFKPGRNGKTKLRVWRDGKLWLAKSRAEWREETGLGEQQYRRAVLKLADLGLVVSEVHLFAGKTTPFLWLNQVRLQQMVGIQQALEAERTVETTEPDRSKRVDQGSVDPTVPLQRLRAETTTETVARLRLATAEREDPDRDRDPSSTDVREDQDPKITMREGGKMKGRSAADVLKALQEKNLHGPGSKVNTKALVVHWKKRLALLSGAFVKEPTGKDVGQMGLFLKAVGEARALAVLDWALQNWTRFTFEASEAKGLKVTPDQPVIGFLLAHHDVAVQLSAQKPKVKAAPPKPVTQVPVPAAPVTPPSEENPNAAQDMIAQALAQFGKGKTQ